MAVLKSESEMFPSKLELIFVNQESSIEVGMVDTPALRKHIGGKSLILKLDVDPLEKSLTMLEVVELKLNLDLS